MDYKDTFAQRKETESNIADDIFSQFAHSVENNFKKKETKP